MKTILSSPFACVSLFCVAMAFAMVAPPDSRAEGKNVVPAIGSLRAPVSPAFVVLGVEPTSIEKPSTPPAIGLSIVNSTEEFTSLPKDLAMEFSPYWLQSHSDFNWEGEVDRSIKDSIQRTASISFATANLGTVEKPATGMSLGVRTAIISGTMTENTQQRLRELESELRAISRALQSDAIYKELVKDSRTGKDEAEKAAKLIIAEDYVNKMFSEKKIDVLTDVHIEREGFMWEVAAGSLWEVPDNEAQKGKNRGWASWSTFSYRHERANFLGVLRVVENDLISSESVFDWGVRLLVEGKMFSVSAEYLKRNFLENSEAEAQERYIGLIDYRVSPAVGVSFSFGQDFESDVRGTFVSKLGLSLGANPN